MPVVRRAISTQAQRVNGVSVFFARGLLTVHAANASLSEVLFQIQKQTGAEIAIPAGTEQERVAADFGPGSPSAVMGELLNGSGLNFVVVGSPADPTQLRSVILSRKTGGVDSPSSFQVAQSPPPQTAPIIEANDLENAAQPPENPPEQVPADGSPNRIDPPPDKGPNYLYEAALDGTPQSAEIHYKLALLYDDKVNDPLHALHHFKRYLVLNPDGVHATEVRDFLHRDEVALGTSMSGDSVVTRSEAARLRNENLNQASRPKERAQRADQLPVSAAETANEYERKQEPQT